MTNWQPSSWVNFAISLTDQGTKPLIQAMRISLGILLLLSAPLARSELTSVQVDTLYELCLPEKTESGWLELGWEIDLWKARERAAREGKPIFLWEMDGHPLGCT